MTPCWVLLRGLTREAGHWGDFRRRFHEVEPGAAVVAIDLPGAGAFHRRPCPASVAAIAAQVRQALAARGPHGPVRLFGLSLGGMVAAHWAAQAPDVVTHCVVVNTSLGGGSSLSQRLNPWCWPALLGSLVQRDDRRAEQAVLRLTSADPRRHLPVLEAWLHIRTARPVSRSNALRQLVAAARCRLPVPAPSQALVLCSQGDRLVDPACSHRLAQQWTASCRLHPWAGHDLPLDDPDWVLNEVRRWFDGGDVPRG